MKNILKAVGAGLALGAALFVVPFAGRLVLFVLLLRVAFRLLRGGRRRFSGPWSRRMAGAGPAFGSLPGVPVPIDNQWYRPAPAPAGPASSVAVA